MKKVQVGGGKKNKFKLVLFQVLFFLVGLRMTVTKKSGRRFKKN